MTKQFAVSSQQITIHRFEIMSITKVALFSELLFCLLIVKKQNVNVYEHENEQKQFPQDKSIVMNEKVILPIGILFYNEHIRLSFVMLCIPLIWGSKVS